VSLSTYCFVLWAPVGGVVGIGVIRLQLFSECPVVGGCSVLMWCSCRFGSCVQVLWVEG